MFNRQIITEFAKLIAFFIIVSVAMLCAVSFAGYYQNESDARSDMRYISGYDNSVDPLTGETTSVKVAFPEESLRRPMDTLWTAARQARHMEEQRIAIQNRIRLSRTMSGVTMSPPIVNGSWWMIDLDTVENAGDLFISNQFSCQSPGYYQVSAELYFDCPDAIARTKPGKVKEVQIAAVKNLTTYYELGGYTPGWFWDTRLPIPDYTQCSVRAGYASGADWLELHEGDKVGLAVKFTLDLTYDLSYIASLRARLSLDRTGDLRTNVECC